MMLRILSLVAALAAIAAGCGGGSPDGAGSPSPPSPVVTTLSPTVSASPIATPSPPASPPPTRGAESEGCVNGWRTPVDGTPLSNQPLGIIRRTSGVGGPLAVTDMRYFEGPESPPSDKGYLLMVRRWYVRLYAEDDPSFQGRFLVEARRFGRGLAAVAPYGSEGFRSSDWIGFQFESSDAEPKAYPGLPGLWPGTPYDFVKGGEGLQIPGLPEEVAGCLEGT